MLVEYVGGKNRVRVRITLNGETPQANGTVERSEG